MSQNSLGDARKIKSIRFSVIQTIVDKFPTLSELQEPAIQHKQQKVRNEARGSYKNEQPEDSHVSPL